MGDYSNFPGPTNEDAIEELSRNLTGDLWQHYVNNPNRRGLVVPEDFKKKFPSLIRESIKEGVEAVSGVRGLGTSMNWRTDGYSRCEELIKRIIRNKVYQYKLNHKKRLKAREFIVPAFKKKITKELPEEIEVEISKYLGGKKRRYRNTSKRSRKNKKTKRKKSKRNK